MTQGGSEGKWHETRQEEPKAGRSRAWGTVRIWAFTLLSVSRLPGLFVSTGPPSSSSKRYGNLTDGPFPVLP